MLPFWAFFSKIYVYLHTLVFDLLTLILRFLTFVMEQHGTKNRHFLRVKIFSLLSFFPLCIFFILVPLFHNIFYIYRILEKIFSSFFSKIFGFLILSCTFVVQNSFMRNFPIRLIIKTLGSQSDVSSGTFLFLMNSWFCSELPLFFTF